MFKIFEKKAMRTTEPLATLMVSGRIGLNKTASARLVENAVERALLLWDEETRQVGIRPLSKKDPRSYKLNQSKKAASLALSTLTFFQHINYKLDKTRSFPVEWNDEEGMYVFTIPAEHLNASARKKQSAKPAPKVQAAKVPPKESQVASHLTQ